MDDEKRYNQDGLKCHTLPALNDPAGLNQLREQRWAVVVSPDSPARFGERGGRVGGGWAECDEQVPGIAGLIKWHTCTARARNGVCRGILLLAVVMEPHNYLHLHLHLNVITRQSSRKVRPTVPYKSTALNSKDVMSVHAPRCMCLSPSYHLGAAAEVMTSACAVG